MGRKRKGCNNFNKIFGNMKRGFGGGCRSGCKGGFGGFGGFGWFTPARCCVCGAIFTTLLISGVGFYGIIIVGLLLVIMQMCN